MFSESKAIAYVESPGQLINAFELAGKFKSLSIIVRYNGSQYNDRQIDSVKSFYLKCFPHLAGIKFSHVRAYSKFFLVMTRKIFAGGGNLRVFVGSFRSGYVRSIRFLMPNLTLLDDGVATLSYQEQCGSKPFDLFTFMGGGGSASGQQICLNDYALLKGISKNVPDEAQKVWFFGSKYVQAGMMELEVYQRVVSCAVSSFDQVVYIPHREERDEDLGFLSSLGVEVSRFDLPSELELVTRGAPLAIAGFYSAALATAKVIAPQVDVYVYDISSLVSSNHRDAYRDLKRYFSTFGKLVSVT